MVEISTFLFQFFVSEETEKDSDLKEIGGNTDQTKVVKEEAEITTNSAIDLEKGMIIIYLF